MKESMISLTVSLTLHALILACLVLIRPDAGGLEESKGYVEVTLDMISGNRGKPEGFQLSPKERRNSVKTLTQHGVPEHGEQDAEFSDRRHLSPGLPEDGDKPETAGVETSVEQAFTGILSNDKTGVGAGEAGPGENNPDGHPAAPGMHGAEDKTMDAGRKAVPLYSLNPPPVYPRTARVRRLEGMVEINVLVDSDGRVRELNLRRSSGFSVLDQAALNSVKVWLFEPGTDCRGPVSMWVVVPLVFKLTAV